MNLEAKARSKKQEANKEKQELVLNLGGQKERNVSANSNIQNLPHVKQNILYGNLEFQ